ncbi:hypothetical protein SAMN04487965_0700 [Microbulbifer donghaiensis]|uniref:Gifsy-1 prophage protein n=1 Tax=Microbulbifer donghaiensis TaxID=494016 RepID=A0A1M4WIC3_9GAMM|nr:hypothetical protein [Microbulbifer donghaiensis]SHE81041.1 hypothetical protein SAMN04487965_0700 [Microbulbifer donghaiensis]
MQITAIWILLGLVFLSTPLHAEEKRKPDILFGPGVSSSVIRGTLSGNESTNYQLRAKAGQLIRVTLFTDNAGNFFNIYAPGNDPGDEAMYIGAVSGNSFSGEVPADGIYTLQLFLIRGEARHNASASYTLKVEIGNKPSAAVPQDKVFSTFARFEGHRLPAPSSAAAGGKD